jgi:hypothetical protein
MMVDSKIYKGIEYVQLNELPGAQREKISQTLNNDLLIKIMIDGKIIHDCLQYKDYSFWYHSVYKAKSIGQPAETTPVEFQTKLVFK